MGNGRRSPSGSRYGCGVPLAVLVVRAGVGGRATGGGSRSSAVRCRPGAASHAEGDLRGRPMRNWTGGCGRFVVVAGVLALAFSGVPAAGATPRPRAEEWWFSSWDMQKKVWPLTTGRGVTVAVLDTGVNARLRDLAGVVLPGRDLTGYKDDGRIDRDTEKGGHGTAMAALIAGQGPAMVGVAPAAKILPVTMFRKTPGFSIDDAQADGIRYAVKHGAKVISMSTGGASPNGPLRCDYYLQSAVDYAIKHDVVLVAAAGNDGDTSNGALLPDSCPGVLLEQQRHQHVDRAGRRSRGTRAGEVPGDVRAPGRAADHRLGPRQRSSWRRSADRIRATSPLPRAYRPGARQRAEPGL